MTQTARFINTSLKCCLMISIFIAMPLNGIAADQAEEHSNHFTADEVASRLDEGKEIDPTSLYKIEIIVFAQRENIGMQMELWEKPKQLHYPENLISLISQQDYSAYQQALIAQEKNKAFVTESIAAALALSQNGSDSFIAAPKATEVPDATKATESTEALDTSASENANTDKFIVEQQAIPLPPRLTALKANEHQLNAMATTLRRRSGFRLLFHEAWFQQLNATKNSASIIINAGDSYDENRELQGSITVSKDRFLHLKSDLWFSQFLLNQTTSETLNTVNTAENSNLTELDWLSQRIDMAKPMLPPPPQDQMLTIPANDLHSVFINSGFDLRQLSPEGISLMQERGLIPPSELLNSSALGNNYDSEDFDESQQRDENQDLDSILASLEQSPKQTKPLRQFRPAQIYLLREDRKISTDQLHYFDHPYFGLIAIISQYEPPPLEE